MTTTRTFRATFARRLGGNLLVVGAVICAGIIGTATETTVAADRPEVTTSPAALIATNDCWTGEAPAGVEIPGRVVVTVDGVTRIGGERMVGKTFAQLFDGVDHGLTVHAFCR